MRLTILALADYGSIDAGTQKLNILGIFTTIQSAKFPARHRRFVIVAKIAADLGDDTDQHNFKMVLQDEDGVLVAEAGIPFSLPRNDDGIRIDFNAVVEFNGLEFPHAGHYQTIIFVDDKEIGTTSIELALVNIKR